MFQRGAEIDIPRSAKISYIYTLETDYVKEIRGRKFPFNRVYNRILSPRSSFPLSFFPDSMISISAQVSAEL